MSIADARELNWRFLIPDQAVPPLVLDRDDALLHASLSDAVPRPTSDGVVVPDLGSWAAGASGRRVLEQAAEAVAPGGWLCVCFPNRLFPPSATTRGAMVLHHALGTLRAAGLSPTSVHLLLPDHRHPALLVDARRRDQLDYVFRHLFLTYVPGSSLRVRLARRVLAAARGAALLAPHRLRVGCAPGYCVVAWRPGD